MEKKEKETKKIELEDIEIDDTEDYENVTVEERVIDIEKKINILLVLVVITLVVSLFALFAGLNKDSNKTDDTTTNDNSQTTSTSYDTSAFKEITAQDIADESKKETIVVWIGRQGCGYCAQFAPNIAQVAKDFDIQVRYIDFGKMLSVNSENKLYISDTESYELISSLTGSGDWKTFAADNMGGTPLTLIIKNNKVIGGIKGSATVSSIESAFKDAGLKK